ncbi:MAG TPA: TPM domain-containing protein [Balneolaceae bacterium]|nr:TPM domain-containing protein [Balneolaceae bacterium]
MSETNFLTQEQEQQVVRAIADAEHETSAEIRVHIEDRCQMDPVERAAKVFHKLGMNHTKQKNGVVIYVATEDKKAAVFGGKGIHEQIDENYWSDVLNIIITHFKDQNFAEGLSKAVEAVGKKLKELFPAPADDTNELSDEISYGSKEAER